jgi:hypothetical protein
MLFKKILNSFLAFCITAILWIALCGCDDLGAFDSTTEYYDCFGNVVLIDGTEWENESYSVSEYFYNKESRENFLQGDDGAYKGIEHGEYVYMAIPFQADIDMDTLALYIQSKSDVTVCINVFAVNEEQWSALLKSETNKDDPDQTNNPDPDTRIGETTVHLEKEKWGSFVLDVFNVDGVSQKSIQINKGQYVLLQIKNNSSILEFDEEKQTYVDTTTGLELQKAKLTMTNLLIRALDVKKPNEAQGGE